MGTLRQNCAILIAMLCGAYFCTLVVFTIVWLHGVRGCRLRLGKPKGNVWFISLFLANLPYNFPFSCMRSCLNLTPCKCLHVLPVGHIYAACKGLVVFLVLRLCTLGVNLPLTCYESMARQLGGQCGSVSLITCCGSTEPDLHIHCFLLLIDSLTLV